MKLERDSRSDERHWNPVHLGYGFNGFEIRQPRMEIRGCRCAEHFAGSRFALANVAESLVAERQVHWLLTVTISAFNGSALLYRWVTRITSRLPEGMGYVSDGLAARKEPWLLDRSVSWSMKASSRENATGGLPPLRLDAEILCGLPRR